MFIFAVEEALPTLKNGQIVEIMMIFDVGSKFAQILLELIFVLHQLLQVLGERLWWERDFILEEGVFNLLNHLNAAEHVFVLWNRVFIDGAHCSSLEATCAHGCSPERLLKTNVILFDGKQVINVRKLDDRKRRIDFLL